MQEGDQALSRHACIPLRGRHAKCRMTVLHPAVVFHGQRMALIAENGLLSSPVSTMCGWYRQGSLGEGFQKRKLS